MRFEGELHYNCGRYVEWNDICHYCYDNDDFPLMKIVALALVWMPPFWDTQPEPSKSGMERHFDEAIREMQ